jgi:hypothetical protein
MRISTPINPITAKHAPKNSGGNNRFRAAFPGAGRRIGFSRSDADVDCARCIDALAADGAAAVAPDA